MGIYNKTGKWIVLLQSHPKKEIVIRKDSINYVEYESHVTGTGQCGIRIYFTNGDEKTVSLGDYREDVITFLKEWFED